MKDSEKTKNIISIVVSCDDWKFEELRWLFEQYESTLSDEKWREERERNVQ